MERSESCSLWPTGSGEMARRIREADWAHAPLGTTASWSQPLRTVVDLMLAAEQPMFVVWGPGRRMLYNDAQARVLSDRHPEALGRDLLEVWHEIAADLRPLMDRAFAGEPVSRDAVRAVLDQSGPLKDAPVEWSLTPVRDDRGLVAGLFCIGQETPGPSAADQRLRESEERLRATAQYHASTLEAFGAADYDTDLLTGEIRPSPRLNALYGLPPHERPTLAACLAAVHPEDTALLSTIIDRAEAGERQFQREFRVVWPDGTVRWLLSRGEVLFDEDGCAVRVRGAAIDMTDRRRIEEDLRASEARLAAIFGSASVGLSEIALDGRFLQVNDELCRILGRQREEVLSLGVPDVTHPADVAPSLAAVAQARSLGSSAGFDKRYRRPDGTVVWASSRVTLLRHGTDGPNTLLAVTVDLTDRRAAEEALRESEARLRLAVEVGNLATWDWDMRSGRIEWSDEHYRIDGYQVGEVEPSFEAWAARVHPEDLPGALAAIEQARAGHHDYDHEFRSLHPDGAVRWCTARGRFFHDDSGEAFRMVGVMLDVTQRRSWEERLAVLVSELQHRTRNLLGVVRSVADRTLARADSIEEFQGPFRDRLGALARVNGLLSRLHEGDRITFDELLRNELMGHGMTDAGGVGDQVILRGPEGIRLRSATVQTFALALHELATNALKHGALSGSQGRLEVSWDLTDGPRGERQLRVEWRETGAAPSARIVGSGYGRELIERALPYQLQAETSYEFGPDGLRCIIALPVSAGQGSPGHEGIRGTD